MAPKTTHPSSTPSTKTPTTTPSKKRKAGPQQPNRSQKRQKKAADARYLATQSSSKLFPNGEVNIEKYVKAREFEIKALEEGMQRAKGGLMRRAFQSVPRDLRRRTASHNVKRVPKRKRERAGREMREDNTPAHKKKVTGKMRLRTDTARRLGKLGTKSKKAQKVEKGANVEEHPVTVTLADGTEKTTAGAVTTIPSRKPKVKKATLRPPPLPPAKFRKRQVHKTWLPTHLYHTKRAHMTTPQEPLWRFAIPLTPTAKSYRPTHRASEDRGAITWDMSYMSTIGLHGPEASVEGLLKALGVGKEDGTVWGPKGRKWREGSRTWEGWIYAREAYPLKAIAPATVIWCKQEAAPTIPTPDKKVRRQVFIRVHPAGFLQLWEEVIRLAKVQQPEVTVEDLRFEIGTIEVKGPGAAEALVGTLWPSPREDGAAYPEDAPESIFLRLPNVQNPSSLPKNSMLAFKVSDPRLHHPPRTIERLRPTSNVGTTSDSRIAKDVNQQKIATYLAEPPQKLAQILAEWPIDNSQPPPTIFDRKTRQTAARALPSQKAINRRKTLALPGSYPAPTQNDPEIPILIFVDSKSTWTIVLPWKCVQPVWGTLMYYPLSSGGQPRLGGLQEQRQLLFEHGRPWYPGDFPGTKAGDEWEACERAKREDYWKRRPTGKRVSWESLDLGNDRKGEIGCGWACDWEYLRKGNTSADALQHVPSAVAHDVLQTSKCEIPGALATVKFTLVSRGVPQTCARVYRLPSTDAELKKKWLALLPDPKTKRQQSKKNRENPFLPPLPKDAPSHLKQQRLAMSLIHPTPTPPTAGENTYPAVPDAVDLVGFVTTGNFNLGEGRGTGVGAILLERVMRMNGEAKEREQGLCVVRNAGEDVGRLARWEVV